MSFQAQLGTVVSTIVILSQLSMIWKENVFFRWGTRVAVGFALVYTAFSNLWYLNSRVYNPVTTKGEFLWIIPVILGLMMYSRLSRKYAWLSKYPTSFQLGVGVGVTTVAMLRGQIIDQLGYTVRDIFQAGTSMELFNAIVVLIAVVTVISYFFFTREHTGLVGRSAYIGRVFIMASTAVLWAGDYIWAMAMIAGILSFLINDFIKGLLFGMA